MPAAADCAAFLAASPVRLGMVKRALAHIQGPVQTRDETVSALKSATCLRSTMHLRWNGAAAPLGLVESAMRRAGHPFFGGATQRRKHVALQGSETSGNTAVAGEDETAVEVAPALTMETVNFPGLKKEMERLTTRQMKRVSKVDQRSRIAEQEAAAGKVDFREDETPDVLRIALRLEVERMEKLSDLEASLLGMKSGKDAAFPAALALANEMGIADSKPVPPPRGAKKPKGQPGAPRKPYFVYLAADGTEIWVGRGAADNDELTMHLRDPNNWWLHVSGFPGSHVVIRTVEESVPSEVIKDAAALTLKFSQAGGGRQKVSLTRCRDVTKPSGFNAGQVLLRGEVTSIKVSLKEEETRLERLLATKTVG
ncbi:hypothetical protein T484DRAFT_1967627 [Baffinella frigidus]|nr:hypothetical protein T484DRAFT_1967627 [Cryptophyta sp. CCMP2293]